MTWNGKDDIGASVIEPVVRNCSMWLGSTRTSLHANPGIHRAVPAFDVEASVRYLADQLAKVA